MAKNEAKSAESGLSVHQWVLIVLAVAATNALTGLVVSYTACRSGNWFSYDAASGTVTLDPGVAQIVPLEFASRWRRLRLPASVKDARFVLGPHPAVFIMESDSAMLALRYDAADGLLLENLKTSEVILRYAPELGLLVGSGSPDPAYLSWATEQRLLNPVGTPVYVVGKNQSVELNDLKLYTRIQLDAETYVGRGHHKASPTFTGTAIVRGDRQTLFLSDIGPMLAGKVPWSSIQANSDASVIVGGTVVTLDATNIDTGGSSMTDNPGAMRLVVRQWSPQSTCVTFDNLADTLSNEMYKPDEVIPPDANFWTALAEIDATTFGIYEASRASADTPDNIEVRVDPWEPCIKSAGLVRLQIRNINTAAGSKLLTASTITVPCSKSGWQILCQGENTYLASLANSDA